MSLVAAMRGSHSLQGGGGRQRAIWREEFRDLCRFSSQEYCRFPYGGEQRTAYSGLDDATRSAETLSQLHAPMIVQVSQQLLSFHIAIGSS